MPKCKKCGGDIEFRYVNGILTPLHLDKPCPRESLNKASQNNLESHQPHFPQEFHKPPPVILPKTYRQRCFWCDANVYHHTNGYGDYVLFDSLGQPWQIHHCWKERSCHLDIESSKKRVIYSKKIEFYNSTTKSSLINGVINQLFYKNQSKTNLNIAKLMGLSIDELKLLYKKELEKVYEPALTYRDKCPLCDQLVCYHISNGDYVLFSHLDSPWEIHECPTINVDTMYKASVLDLPVNEFKHKIIEGSINHLCRKSSRSKSPYERAVAETLNISLDKFRHIYKSVCHFYGNRIILKSIVYIRYV